VKCFPSNILPTGWRWSSALSQTPAETAGLWAREQRVARCAC